MNCQNCEKIGFQSEGFEYEACDGGVVLLLCEPCAIQAKAHALNVECVDCAQYVPYQMVQQKSYYHAKTCKKFSPSCMYCETSVAAISMLSPDLLLDGLEGEGSDCPGCQISAESKKIFTLMHPCAYCEDASEARLTRQFYNGNPICDECLD